MTAITDQSRAPAPSAVAGLERLYQAMTRDRRRHLSYVLFLMFASAVAELLAIGAILPFLTLLSAPERLMSVEPVMAVFAFFGAHTRGELVLAATIMFGIAAVLAGLVRLMFAWSSQAFVFTLGHELGVELQRRILYQPYTYHVMTNSSQFVSALEKVHVLVLNILLPLMQAAGAVLISLFIIAVLVIINPVVALASAAAFGLVYLAVSALTRGRLERSSVESNRTLGERVQAVQENMGAIRDILIDRTQPAYVAHFAQIDWRLRSAQTWIAFIAAAPRFVIESFGMVLIAVIALLLASRDGGLGAALPTLGAMALGAQRLLPLLQQVYFGLSQFRGNRAVLDDVVEFLDLDCPLEHETSAPLPMSRSIRFDRVGYTYPGRDVAVLDEIDLTIPCGSRVAFVGRTGSGKSTLVDLLMGLLQPSEGSILIDDEPLTGAKLPAWQANIAHVPQSIFLTDTSILNNIAFGVPKEQIDRARAASAAQRAQLHDFITGLPEGYETEVGERGVRLSGGQRQRLGIARALYKEASVLVLDEATSALDDATETAVMASLESLDERLTVIMIAHRLSTIANCDQVIRLSEGRIVQSGSYAAVAHSLQLENS
ncbi:MAG: ABC transporter ATP-binding protein [Allosphingosinicella sp.]